MTLRCLIVDDSAGFGEVARAILEDQGVEVVGVASSSAEGLSRVRELRPDVALVDIELDGESGFDVARDLAAASRRLSATVILMSAQDPSEYADLIDASPAIGFIPKEELSWEMIRRLLGRGRPR